MEKFKSCSNCSHYYEMYDGPHCGGCFISEHSNWEERKPLSPPADYLDYFRYFPNLSLPEFKMPKFNLPIYKNDAILRIDTDSIKVKEDKKMKDRPRDHKFVKSIFKERRIKEVMFNGPATIIKWEPSTYDAFVNGNIKGDKTVSICGKDDKYDKTTGFLLAVIKEFVDNQSYDNILRTIDSFNDDQEGVKEWKEESTVNITQDI